MDQLSGIFQSELLTDVHPVSVDGFDAQMKGAGDFMRFFALTEKAIHLELSVGQCGNRRSTTLGSG